MLLQLTDDLHAKLIAAREAEEIMAAVRGPIVAEGLLHRAGRTPGHARVIGWEEGLLVRSPEDELAAE